jgi:succinate-semialdehyde dehydrogenase/glutarate-semialdehyde dehydrogenase
LKLLFAEKMAASKGSDPFEERTELGPLSRPEGAADLDRDARKTVEAGAKILTGGRLLDRPGEFYAPTVVATIPKDSPACKERLGAKMAFLKPMVALNPRIPLGGVE